MNVNQPAASFMVLPGMKPVYTSNPDRPGEKRLPGFTWLPNRVRHMFISMLGEFVGTYLFLFFAFAGTQVANTPPGEADAPPNTATLLYISLAFGFSLAVNVWIFFRISGGLFNPAVTIAFALVGAISWFKALLLIISQLLAGISAAGIVSALFPGNLVVRTTLNPNTSVVRGLFIEMLLTAELIFCIFMLAAEKHRATFLAPIGIGLCLFVSLLAGIWFTGGSLNPARTFGPDVVLQTFEGYHWIYWVGPLLGAIVAVIFYRFIKVLEYETANPGVDDDGREYVLERYRESPEPDGDDERHRNRRTDGTDESEEPAFMPPIHPINKPLRAQQSRSISSHFNVASVDSAGNYMPKRPLPAHPHGGDGHESESSDSSADHPNKRPRAQHRHSSLSRRSSRPSHSRRGSRHREASDYSYQSGPSAESGESTYSSRSSA